GARADEALQARLVARRALPQRRRGHALELLEPVPAGGTLVSVGRHAGGLFGTFPFAGRVRAALVGGRLQLAHDHPARTQDAIAQQVAALHDLADVAGFDVTGRVHTDGFVLVRVERMALALDLAHAVALEHALEQPAHHAQTLDERVRLALRAAARLLFVRLEREMEVVEYGQQLARERLDRHLAHLLDLLAVPAADVGEVGEAALELAPQRVALLAQ